MVTRTSSDRWRIGADGCVRMWVWVDGGVSCEDCMMRLLWYGGERCPLLCIVYDLLQTSVSSRCR